MIRAVPIAIVSLVLVFCVVAGMAAAWGTGRSAALAVGADALYAAGIDGSGVTIAIIDTGVDPGHAALSATTHYAAKIVDWQDFSGRGTPAQRASGVDGTYLAEGDVLLSLTARARGNVISTVRGTVHLGSIRSQSGVYHYGFFRERQVAAGGPLGHDLGQSGVSGQEYLVLAVDSETAGLYDVVYVDTRGEMDLRGEVAMTAGPSVLNWFGSPNPDSARRLPFCVTHIEPDGRLINLGFDANGHGTHMAGVAAGYHRTTSFAGVAPGAEIMALKALRSDGDGSWDGIWSAMEYAADQGAMIISVSVGGGTRPGGIPERESALMDELAARHNILILVAAGNTGPALGTISAPGNPDRVLIVGAAMTPMIWGEVFGHRVEYPAPYLYSSVGPRPDGALVPSLVGPGAAVSTAPLWLSPDGLEAREGTSVAVPAVAGAAALLWQKASAEGIEVSAPDIRMALQRGASPIDGYTWLQQGAGLVDAGRAWLWLMENHGRQFDNVMVALGEASSGPLPAVSSQMSTDPLRMLPGSDLWWVTGSPGSPGVLGIASDRDGVSVVSRLVLPPGVPRRLAVLFEGDTSGSGLDAAWIRGVCPEGHQSMDLLHTWINPITMIADNAHRAELRGSLAAGEVKRHYLMVSAGTGQLVLRLGVGELAGQPTGRVRMLLLDPTGRQVLETDWVGAGGETDKALWVSRISNPTPGIWQLVMYSSATILEYGLDRSEYRVLLEANRVLSAPEHIHLTPRDDGLIYAGSVPWTWSGHETLELLVSGVRTEPPVAASVPLSARSGEARFEELVVAPGTGYLWIGADTRPAGPHVDLFVYHYDADTGLPSEVGRSTWYAHGSSGLLLRDPPPGRYRVWAEASHPTAHTIRFDLSWVQVPRSDDDQWVLEPREDGTHVTLDPGLEIQERLFGLVAWVSPEESRLVHWVPLIVEACDGLIVSVPYTVSPAGPRRQVTINVRDASTLEPVTVDLEVDGRIYAAVDGRLTITLDLEGSGHAIEVTPRPTGGYLPGRTRVFSIDVGTTD